MVHTNEMGFFAGFALLNCISGRLWLGIRISFGELLTTVGGWLLLLLLLLSPASFECITVSLVIGKGRNRLGIPLSRASSIEIGSGSLIDCFYGCAGGIFVTQLGMNIILYWNGFPFTYEIESKIVLQVFNRKITLS